jgi:hypothetical protein
MVRKRDGEPTSYRANEPTRRRDDETTARQAKIDEV